MSNQASGASTAFRNSNYIGSSNNATNYGIRNEFSSQGSGVSYGISSQLNLINHNGGSSQIGIYSFLLGGSNTSGNTYGVWVNNMTSGSGTDYGIYTSGEDFNYFQGNVGIGVTDPDAKLEVNGQVKITGGSPGANKVLTSDVNGLASWQPAGGDTDWTISGNNVYRNSGNVGIGITGPSYKLHVVGRLKTDGITESSDIRLKKDIYTLTDALKKVQKLRGVSYQWKETEGRRSIKGKQIGFIAQEVEEIIPELVDTDNEGFKSIQYSHLVPLLVESIKALSLELDKKDKILNGLKADLNTKSDDINELQEMLKHLYQKMDIPYSHTNKNIANE